MQKPIIDLYNERNASNETIDIVNTSINIIFVIIVKVIYMKLFWDKDLIDSQFIQIGLISILTVSFYSISIRPLFYNNYIGRYFNSIIKDSILLVSSDFVQDAKIDTPVFDLYLNTIGTFTRFIINLFI